MDLHDLLTDDYDSELGEHPPSQESIDRAVHWLSEMCAAAGPEVPRWFASTTGNGDIRIYWCSECYGLHLIFPTDAHAPPALYRRVGDSESFEEEVSLEGLAQILRSLPTGRLED